MPEPTDSLNDVLGSMADRVGKYAEVVQNAAKQNAKGEYPADAALRDMQHMFSFALRDAAEAGAAMITIVGGMVSGSDTAAEASRSKASKKSAGKKASAAKKTTARKRTK